jgi:predicted branched-subunit amino acid permease
MWRFAALDSPRDRQNFVKTQSAAAVTLEAMTTRANPAAPRRADGSGAGSPPADAAQDVLALTPALLPIGAALGVVIAASRTGDVAGLLGAPLVYGGSAQLTATTMFQHGAALAAIVGSAALVNARLVFYSATLAQRFHAQPRWFRFLGAHFIIDQTYLSALRRPEHVDQDFRRYWLCLGLGVMGVWSAAVGLGLLLGPRLPSLPHLPLVGTALFVGMLVPRLRDRAGVAAAAASGVVASVAAHAPAGVGVLAGTVVGVAAGLAVRNGRRT